MSCSDYLKLSILAYLDNQLTLRIDALQCWPLFWVSWTPCFLLFFVSTIFFRRQAKICIWPVGQVRDSETLCPWAFFMTWLAVCSLQLGYIFHCGLLFAALAEKSLFDSIFILFELCCGFYGSTLYRDFLVKVGQCQYLWIGSDRLDYSSSSFI